MKKKVLNQEVIKKLKKYSAATAAVAFIGSTANAQIIYTDVDPDVTLNSFPSNYQIDFDGDSNIDIDMTMEANGSYNQIKAVPGGTNTSIVTSGYAALLNTSNLISSANSFGNSNYDQVLISAYTSGTSVWGNWTAANVDDKYVGVKFDISGAMHYGWIRLSTTYTDAFTMSVTIKDFAYQSIADSSIYAGAVDIIGVEADLATTIVASDVNDNNNGEDLQVAFVKATDETTLSEYRIMVVKAANVGTFDLTAAEAVVTANYMSVSPTGSDINTILTATSNDVDGDAIANGVPYKVFVLSMADGTNATLNALSDTSNAITLETIVAVSADTASTIVATDVNDNNNGEDLQVAFIKATDETTLSEYRLMVVKAANVGTFDLTAAEAVIAANYLAVTPTGSDISTILTATSNDVDGDAIANGVPYKVLVLSMADGTNATLNALSDTSNAVTLETIVAVSADTASTIVASDVNNNNNGEDLQVAFVKATDETTLSEYRLMAVKAANAGTFDLTAAEAVITANYLAITPTGSDISTIFTATSNDVDGDAIADGVPYKVFVLSIADGTNATLNALSDTSNAITLVNTTSINEQNLVSNIYPNPVSNILNIELQDVNNYVIKLTDISGKEMLVKTIKGNTTEIDVSGFAKSTYLLSVSSNESTITKKIIIK